MEVSPRVPTRQRCGWTDRQTDRIKTPRRTWRTPPPHPPPTLPSADDTTHTQRSEASDHQCAQSPTDPTRCPWTYSVDVVKLELSNPSALGSVVVRYPAHPQS